MAVFTWRPIHGGSKTVTPKVRQVEFGDGYSQRVGDGINIIRPSYSLTFRGFSETINAIDQFLQSRAGVESFTWTPESGATAAQYLCKSWAVANESFGIKSLTATFERVFEN